MPFQLRSFTTDAQVRYVFLHGELDSRELCILNIYAPSSDDAELFCRLQCELVSCGGMPIIWAGDFNCVLDRALDRSTPKLGTKPHMTSMLCGILDNLHFVDIRREMHPTSTTFSCYSPTHGAYSRLDRFLLGNDGSLDILRVGYQVRFLSNHYPLLLECGTHSPRLAIPLWRMQSELLGDHEYRHDIQEVLAGYFSENWTTALSRGLEWEALKVVIRGVSLAKTYGIRKKLDREGRAVRGHIGALWSRLDSYVRKDF
ncbi:hypothetical protein NDU88_002610 [Pleurodeles waltl]|uniref:Endonuclease/exonuclease/phosphatase domain-containing protein n=1 Tax=Pleurodeles waltl TaxID=8319 RepID=A0AAV7VD04_PLEWA|nr:hypothetical protein NDU88_002610 [Pleurodeles waltl]